jgi:hypothetical protein
MAATLFAQGNMPPEFLYKYMPTFTRDANIDERARRQERYDQCFTEKSLYFSRPTEFNDPMDTKPHVVFDTGTPAQLEKLRKKFLSISAVRKNPALQSNPDLLRQQVSKDQTQFPNVGDDNFSDSLRDAITDDIRDVGILCLSETDRCPVMFYHYGDAHRGACLKFRANADYFVDAEPVQYVTAYPEIDYLACDDGTEFKRIFMSKYESWQYEKEWRVVYFEQQHLNAHSRRLTYTSELLEAVIFGYRMPEEERVRVSDLLSQAGRHVSLLEAQLKAKSFELNVVEWQPRPA